MVSTRMLPPTFLSRALAATVINRASVAKCSLVGCMWCCVVCIVWCGACSEGPCHVVICAVVQCGEMSCGAVWCGALW